MNKIKHIETHFRPIAFYQNLVAVVVLFLLINPFYAGAQVKFKCGQFYADSIENTLNPDALRLRSELERFTQQYLTQKSVSAETKIIPVVFHVLHEYGSERVSEEYLNNAIENMNRDFSATNTDLGQVIAEFKPIIGAANIEFRLAKLDPNGNCTSGVVYYNTPLTNNADDDLKYVIRNWDPSRYLNVWSVKTIGFGAAAWSQYPGVSPSRDGVVSIYTYIGRGHTLGHEVGHYLNLMHTWGNSNEPGLPENCDTDDNVEDTPNTMGSNQTCNKAQVTCGSLDNVQNFMDYSTCDVMFTQGQVQRMQAALSSSISSRNNLWSAQNLEFTGTSDNFVAELCSPMADFDDNIGPICMGSTVQFNDFSTGRDIDTYVWEFEGGTPAVSTLQNPVITYNTPGLYNVSLTVSNSAGSNTLLREKKLFVVDTLGGIIAPVLYNMEAEGFPYFNNDPQLTWTSIDNGDYNWEPVKINGNTAWSILNNQTDGTKNSIITPNINVSSIENFTSFSFDLAFAKRSAELPEDELRVYFSIDGGKTWAMRYGKTGNGLTTNGQVAVSGLFIPTNADWRTEVVNLPQLENLNHLRIKFEMNSYGGNKLYIDNLKIGDPATSVYRESFKYGLSVYPNPAQNELNLSYNLPQSEYVTIEIVNLFGATIQQWQQPSAQGQNEVTLNLNKELIKAGAYMVLLKTSESAQTRRLIVN